MNVCVCVCVCVCVVSAAGWGRTSSQSQRLLTKLPDLLLWGRSLLHIRRRCHTACVCMKCVCITSHTHTHRNTQTHTQTHTHTYIYIYIYTYICTLEHKTTPLHADLENWYCKKYSIPFFITWAFCGEAAAVNGAASELQRDARWLRLPACGARPVGLHVTVLSGLFCELNSVLFPQSLLVIPALPKVHSAIPDSCSGWNKNRKLPSFTNMKTKGQDPRDA